VTGLPEGSGGSRSQSELGKTTPSSSQEGIVVPEPTDPTIPLNSVGSRSPSGDTGQPGRTSLPCGVLIILATSSDRGAESSQAPAKVNEKSVIGTRQTATLSRSDCNKPLIAVTPSHSGITWLRVQPSHYLSRVYPVHHVWSLPLVSCSASRCHGATVGVVDKPAAAAVTGLSPEPSHFSPSVDSQEADEVGLAGRALRRRADDDDRLVLRHQPPRLQLAADGDVDTVGLAY